MTDLAIILKKPERLSLLDLHEVIPIEEEEATRWRQAIQTFKSKKRAVKHPDAKKVFSVRAGTDGQIRVVRIK